MMRIRIGLWRCKNCFKEIRGRDSRSASLCYQCRTDSHYRDRHAVSRNLSSPPHRLSDSFPSGTNSPVLPSSLNSGEGLRKLQEARAAAQAKSKKLYEEQSCQNCSKLQYSFLLINNLCVSCRFKSLM